MKDGLENIDEVFKQAFDGFEANVDPSVWSNVQSSISSGGVTPQVDPGSSIVSTSVVKSVVVKIAAAVVAVGTIATATYYAVSSPTEKETIAENVVVEEVEEKETPVEKNEVLITETIKEENKSTEQQDVVKDKVLDKSTEKTMELPKDKEEVTIPKVEDQKLKNTSNFGSNNKTSDNVKSTEDENQKLLVISEESDNKKPETNNDKQLSSPPVADTQPKPEVKKEAVVDNIPKAFSPNGDGQNDVIKITGENLEKLEVVVMDKTGKIVYKINNLEQEWDGKDMNGFDLIPGIYYMAGVVVDADGNSKNIKQAINLFK